VVCLSTRFQSFRPPGARARIWFGLQGTGNPTRHVPPNQVRFGVPNLIRATNDNRPSRSAMRANQIREL
jgi:hypothetical protein